MKKEAVTIRNLQLKDRKYKNEENNMSALKSSTLERSLGNNTPMLAETKFGSSFSKKVNFIDIND